MGRWAEGALAETPPGECVGCELPVKKFGRIRTRTCGSDDCWAYWRHIVEMDHKHVQQPHVDRDAVARRDQQIKRLHQSGWGYTAREIAEMVGASREVVSNRLSKMGLVDKKRSARSKRGAYVRLARQKEEALPTDPIRQSA